MKSELNNKCLSLGKRLISFVIDFTTVYFSFNIFRFLISYFYFLPFLPYFFITWLSYYVISFGIWKQTLGGAFFGAYLFNKGNATFCWLRIGLRESLSLPAILLIVFYLLSCSPYLYEHASSFLLIIGGVLFIIVALFVLASIRTKLFKLMIVQNANISNGTSQHRRKHIFIIYLVLLLLAGGTRYIHTFCTNDIKEMRASFNELPLNGGNIVNIVDSWDWSWYITPRPTVASVEKYVNFLYENRQDVNDYIFSLYNQYDHIILCERMHSEMTQYDMIYDLVTDSRFVDNIGVVFTETGNVESQNAYQKMVNIDFSNDIVLQQELSSFMMMNQSFHLLWSNTNWFNFLKKMYYYNHNKEKKIDVLFTDRANWVFNDKIYDRDRFMANNILSTIKERSLNKSLTIMNYRHAYLKGQDNCSYYIAKEFPGKVANVLINTVGWNMQPLQHGKWDVAFEQMPENAFAFNLEGSPFGKDNFDHFIFFSPLSRRQYEEMFNGVIYYNPLYQHFFGYGFPYMTQPANI